jgi:hypothetical protein
MGCQQQRIAAAAKQQQSDIEVCRNGEKLTRENALERADCMGNARRKYAYAVSPQTEWIVEQEIAANRVSALKYAEGRISKEEYETEAKQHYAEGAQTEAGINMQQRQQNIQALALWQSMQPASVAAQQPYMMPVNRPIQTNCMELPGSINCTTYR